MDTRRSAKCTGKIKHKSRGKALAAKRSIERLNPEERYEVYACSFGSHFHVGHLVKHANQNSKYERDLVMSFMVGDIVRGVRFENHTRCIGMLFEVLETGLRNDCIKLAPLDGSEMPYGPPGNYYADRFELDVFLTEARRAAKSQE